MSIHHHVLTMTSVIALASCQAIDISHETAPHEWMLASDDVQESTPFELSRHVGKLISNMPDKYTQDISYITKGRTAEGRDYAFFTFGDTFEYPADTFFGNTVAYTLDADAGDGITYNYKQAAPGIAALGLTPMSMLPHSPEDPDATENQLWFGRSFVLGNDLYTYYGSFGPGQTKLGRGLAVLRGGLKDADLSSNHMDEFERIPKSKFWAPPFWFDGDPIVKTESDGITYLYLFNQFGLQRVPFTPDGVENLANYRSWNGTSWIVGAASPLWTGEFVLRATCQWNAYLGKWLALYSLYDSADGKNGQMAYRTADSLTGPWSARKVFYYGTSASAGNTLLAGDYYNPVHLPFWDKDSGKTVYIVASSYGSHGPMGIYEHTFDHTVTTTRIGAVSELSPQGLDEDVHVRVQARSFFFFGETDRLSDSGAVRKTYSNSSIASGSDTDLSDGISFDTSLRYGRLRPRRDEERAAWITAADALPGRRSPIGAFYRALDLNGIDLGTGYAYTRTNARGVARFMRADGFLPISSRASTVTGFLPETNSRVILNDEHDASGSVYFADTNAGSTADLSVFAENSVDVSNYTFFTATRTARGLENRSWSSDETQALALFDNASRPSIFENAYTGNWIALYTMKTSAAGENSTVAMRTAQTFDGPWSEPTTLFSLPNTTGSKGRLYNAQYLAGFDQDGGKVIYFSASDFDAGAVLLYQVRLDG